MLCLKFWEERSKKMLEVYLLVALSAALNTLGQVSAKWGSCVVHGKTTFQAVCAMPLAPMLWLSVACYGASLVVWVFVLSRVHLMVAASLFSLSYLLTVLAGVVIFNETLSFMRLGGVALIIGGVYLVSLKV